MRIIIHLFTPIMRRLVIRNFKKLFLKEANFVNIIKMKMFKKIISLHHNPQKSRYINYMMTKKIRETIINCNSRNSRKGLDFWHRRLAKKEKKNSTETSKAVHVGKPKSCLSLYLALNRWIWTSQKFACRQSGCNTSYNDTQKNSKNRIKEGSFWTTDIQSYINTAKKRSTATTEIYRCCECSKHYSTFSTWIPTSQIIFFLKNTVKLHCGKAVNY